METTATVFGISVADTRLVGRFLSWVWLVAGFIYGDFLVMTALIYNALHYNPEIGDFFSDLIGYENLSPNPLISFNALFGLVSYEYFLDMSGRGIFYLLFGLINSNDFYLKIILIGAGKPRDKSGDGTLMMLNGWDVWREVSDDPQYLWLAIIIMQVQFVVMTLEHLTAPYLVYSWFYIILLLIEHYRGFYFLL